MVSTSIAAGDPVRAPNGRIIGRAIESALAGGMLQVALGQAATDVEANQAMARKDVDELLRRMEIRTQDPPPQGGPDVA